MEKSDSLTSIPRDRDGRFICGSRPSMSDDHRRKISDACKLCFETHPEIGIRISGKLKGRVLSDEHRKHLSENHRKHNSEEHKERIRHSVFSLSGGKWKGKKMSMSARLNMSLAQKGKVLSDECKRKISESLKGRCVSDYARKRVSETHIGTHHSLNTCLKMSISHKGKGLGRRHSDDTKAKIRMARSKRVFPMKDTAIEMIVENWLIEHNIRFESHKAFKVGESYHQVDRYLPEYRIAIECDGKYWHSLPAAVERDKLVDKVLTEGDIKVLRLPEDEINSGSYTQRLEEVVGD